jgi:hypothetical protein
MTTPRVAGAADATTMMRMSQEAADVAGAVAAMQTWTTKTTLPAGVDGVATMTTRMMHRSMRTTSQGAGVAGETATTIEASAGVGKGAVAWLNVVRARQSGSVR